MYTVGMKPTIILGADHSGQKLKNAIKEYLEAKDYHTEDLGEYSEEPTDYPDVAAQVARTILKKDSLGVLICGTGIGMSIAANRYPGIRAVHVSNSYEARKSREDNNANILCLGERVLGEHAAFEIVDTWLRSTFSHADRHIRRNKKLDQLRP